MRHEGSHTTVAFLIEKGFEDISFLLPFTALRQAGVSPLILSPRRRILYQGKRGRTSFMSDAAPIEMSPEQFDALILPGGDAPTYLRRNRQIIRFLQRAMGAGTLIAAALEGPQVLIESEFLQGRQMTCESSLRTDLRNAGAIYTHLPVVFEQNILTARSTTDLPLFTATLLQALQLTIPGFQLPNPQEHNAPWWDIAAAWGGTSRQELLQTLQDFYLQERALLAFCQFHRQHADADVRSFLSFVELSTEHHCHLLLTHMQEVERSYVPPTQEQHPEALRPFDRETLLLTLFDLLQARKETLERMHLTLTDPASGTICDHIEINTSRCEDDLAQLLHSLPENQFSS
uniref:DJ-1/PfpI domain-containing protein n=1 Tax=Thermosporothrix sp. COM3 TaxID=2490863 RepID=A0A455SJS7_9CHLR|nr:hypothetical protein KTC_11460 [Thermosporothrix sp. COM3]